MYEQPATTELSQGDILTDWSHCQPIPLENAFRHYRLMNFVGAVVNARGPAVAVEFGQQRVIANAQSPMHLNSPVNDAHHHVGHVKLDERDLLARPLGAVAVDHPAGLEDH